jgi:gamma-glutamylcyclotransferase (GGCT)/AIG2-like uncharacterized protein YtfP
VVCGPLQKRIKPGLMQESQAGAGQRSDILVPSGMELEDILAMVSPGKCVLWLTNGNWGMHDMLTSLLGKTGPANVFISSYAFSEYPAMIIQDMKVKGTIRELHCLFDKRLDVRSTGALNTMRKVATRIQLVHTHAKVTVIENDQHLIAVVGSANYTSNKRYESGVILTDRDAALFHKKWILEAFERK